MPLNIGSVTIDTGNATYSGDGIAFALMEGEREAVSAAWWSSATLAQKNAILAQFKAKAEKTATVLVAQLSLADVRITTGQIDSGIPSTTRVLGGALE